MINSMKKKFKKKIISFFITQVLPILLVIILGGAVVALIIELPKMIGDKISEYFAGDFNSGAYENLPLRELRDFFASNPDLGGLEELQSPLMLAKYIDLQLAGTLQTIESETITTRYTDGKLEGVVKTPYNFEYNQTTDIYALPWQMMAATDIANDNFGVLDYSDDVLLLNESLRPRFQGKINNDFEPDIYETHVAYKEITETTREYYYEDTDKYIINPITRELEPLQARRSTSTVTSWTESSEVKIPTILFSQIYYYAAMYNYTIGYEQGDTRSSTSTNTIKDTNDLTVTQEVTTDYSILTPYYEEFDMVLPNTYVRDALQYTVPYNRRDLFQELIKNYPFTQTIQLVAQNAFRSSGIYINDGYGEIQHNFTYPTLKRTYQPNSYFRQDIVNLGKSLIGLDYFWGGKYNKIGFDGNWGKLTLCTSKGSSMSGINIRDGLDCSGFVQWVYLNAGMSIQGGTYSMLSGGKLDEVTLDELKPGDLGFYHNYSNGETGNHVGIYLGYIDGKHLFVNAKGSPGGYDEIHTTGQVMISALTQEHNGFGPVRFKKFYTYKDNVLE